METTEPNYVKGFNAGYRLKKYSPEVFDLLQESLDPNDDFQNGILEGAAQADREQEQERLTELNEIEQENQEREPEQEID